MSQAEKSSAISRWINQVLFNVDSASTYFEAFVEGIDPMWSLYKAKARVEKIQQETSDTITITLRPNRRFPSFSAGQHIQLSVTLDGIRKTRTFSISSSPTELTSQGLLQITIKAVKNGEVTSWLHHTLKLGDIVELSQPSGEFTLPENPESLLYIAGGSGITPVISHLRQLQDSKANHPITVLYYAKNKHDFIFKNELLTIGQRFKHFKIYLIATKEAPKSDNQLAGRLNELHLERAVKFVPEHIYLCGPESFQDNAIAYLKQRFGENKQVHREHFGLTIKTKSGTPQQTYPVVLNKSKTQLECDQNTSLLEAAEKSGLTPNHGCRMGICYTCKCKKQSGIVRNLVTGQLSSANAEDIQLCVSIPESPLVIDL